MKYYLWCKNNPNDVIFYIRSLKDLYFPLLKEKVCHLRILFLQKWRGNHNIQDIGMTYIYICGYMQWHACADKMRL